MTSRELRQKYLEFFKARGHAIIPSASLIPENDPTALFTTAGMHPLVPYLMGEKHPEGQRLVDAQKCVRTDDIDDVGDATHHTFFEMLGNWSLGDYFKEEAIKLSWEFLTSPDCLGLDKNKIAVSVFRGKDQIPKDEESKKIWMALGVPQSRIAELGTKDNWWGLKFGPCGPDTEMFYWTGPGKAPKDFDVRNERWVEIWNDVFMMYNKVPTPHKPDGRLTDLKQKNVDTGMGLERTLAVLNGLDDNYQTDLFINIIRKIEQLSQKQYSYHTTEKYTRAGSKIESFLPNVENSGYINRDKEMRIIADHIRAATFIIGDDKGVTPSNTDQGYIVRRLLKRAIRYGKQLGIKEDLWTKEIAKIVIHDYSESYPELRRNANFIIEQVKEEEEKFSKALERGEKKFAEIESYIKNIKLIAKNPFDKNLSLIEFRGIIENYLIVEPFEKLLNYYDKNLKNKISPLLPLEDKNFDIKEKGTNEFIKKEAENILNNIIINGKTVFDLYQTHGFPIELTKEMAQERGYKIDEKGFEKELKKHQELSRTASAGKFKGGLADASEETKKLHTAAHLLLAALRKVLGGHVVQKGSNITAERLRFDFSHKEKMTPEQIKETEKLVNEAIKADLPVCCEEMPLPEAKKKGAMGVFESKYGEKVKVYKVGEDDKQFSYEICGGPHVNHTGELGRFKILKEESSSAGVRRIKALLE
ncbi:MAG: alanine--tRNA ligase-related protein [Patescibacteria group bacterium]|nr:alanine--tRNA ligase-related protein [Patescibacteria group bacterium]